MKFNHKKQILSISQVRYLVFNQKIIFSLTNSYNDYWLSVLLSWEFTNSFSYLLTIYCTLSEFIKGATSVLIMDCILSPLKNINASRAIVYLFLIMPLHTSCSTS